MLAVPGSLPAATAALGQYPLPAHLEVWSAATPGASLGSRMLLEVSSLDRPDPTSNWCRDLRSRGLESSVAHEILARGGEYVYLDELPNPLRVDILIDDVELAYMMSTAAPAAAENARVIEMCAVGVGSKSEEGWTYSVLELRNRRGNRLAIGLYTGTLPAAQRQDLERGMGYAAGLPDPAGIMIVDDGDVDQSLILVETGDSSELEALRDRILR